MEPFKRINLKEYNTFGISADALYSFFCYNENDLPEILQNDFVKNKNVYVLGGGSNVILKEDIEDVLILMQNKGISLSDEDENFVFLKAAAGEIWDDFVAYCVENNYSGIENLSLIPGTVGASPVQNIGAYGVEVKDVIFEVETIHKKNGRKKSFNNSECKFGYRNSVFKTEFENQYVITDVTFKLSKKFVPKLSYGNLLNELNKKNPTIRDVREAVIRIRENKLPDPETLPNAGSFFKNPVIPAEQYNILKKKFPELVSYPAGENKIKLAAGQLIDLCGLKGFKENGVGIHEKQALVIVNYDFADGNTILKFSEKIQQKVFEKFGVKIEREVHVFP